MTKVYVINLGRKNYYHQWTDPVTGKRITRSARTANRREAERKAMTLETQLSRDLTFGAGSESWDAFQDVYESQHLESLSQKAMLKSVSVLSAFGESMQPCKPSAVSTAMLTEYAAKMRTAGRSEATIASHLTTIRAALSWARHQGFITAVPPIPRTQRNMTGRKARGRPLTIPEFVRMLRAAGTPFGEQTASAWRHMLTGLWLSGLRISEAIRLTWDDPESTRVDLSGPQPLLRVVASQDKGNRDRVLPLTPDFARWLSRTAVEKRTGFVFNPIGKRGDRLRHDHPIIRAIGAIGKAAGVVVDARTGKYASAHDLRRTFGTRWAKRVTTHVLMMLMRHESIETTNSYYVDITAGSIAADLMSKFGERGLNT